jgi:hypothetical protein
MEETWSVTFRDEDRLRFSFREREREREREKGAYKNIRS